MAVTPQDLLAPVGELEADLFPSEVVEGDPSRLLDRLQAYISDAAAQGATTDRGTKAWAYHRAYRAVYLSMSANPIRAHEEGQGTAQFDKDQAARFLGLSEQWLAVFNDEVGAEAPETQGGLPESQSQRAEFGW